MLARVRNQLHKRRLLARARREGSPHPWTLFRDVPENIELWALTHGVREYPELRRLLPGLPSPEIQENFTGASGDATLHQAFLFVSFARSMAREHGLPVHDVLDFGCGWGRITRFLLRDAEPGHVWGIDCYQEMVDLCRATNPHARFERCNPLPPTSFATESVDLIVGFSVFSHLSEPAHREWLVEFRRILRPGGLLIVTTRDRSFIEHAANLRAADSQRANESGVKASFLDTPEALADYDAGKYIYAAVGGGGILDPSFFGETCIPEAYVRQHWPLDIVAFVRDRDVCAQNIIVARHHQFA